MLFQELDRFTFGLFTVAKDADAIQIALFVICASFEVFAGRH